MKTNPSHPVRPIIAGLLALLSSLTYEASAFAQGTAFTYQGRLDSGGAPVTGFFDITFSVWSAASGPAQQGVALTNSSVAVSNGLFTVALDFGPGVFDGDARWLEIGVRTNGSGAFNPLSPRQKISPTPYAITSGNLTGTLPNASLPAGGNWALSSLLTIDGGTLAIDPTSDWVGVGTGTPTAPFTVKPSASFFGIEHTDGTRRLSTYIDGSGCWFGTVSPDKLFFYVNNSVSPAMSIDVSGRVGVGTTSPAWPLDVFANQGVLRLVSGFNNFGSVLELKNTTAGASYLGAINFNNAADAYGGQIAYSGADAMTFRAGGAERIRITSTGNIGIGTTSPAQKLHVSGGGVVVERDSSISSPQLALRETQDGDFVRLQFQAASHPYWHIAVGGGGANQMNFYNSTNGDVMSLTEGGTLFVKVLTITGGADIAEPFQLTEDKLPEGSVVVIDEENPGNLKLSTQAYDSRVAGVISGAGGVQPGLSLQQHGIMEGNQPVALTGRVYVQADATTDAIRPGDLLTTSDTPGCAMKATDPARAQGAVLGKAMTKLEEGRGLVLVLVTLQ